LAIVAGLRLFDYYINAPWTRDGRVRADVVAVAPDVSGLVSQVLVKDNQSVRRGDVLFRIDQEPVLALHSNRPKPWSLVRKASAKQAEEDFKRYDQLSDIAVSQPKTRVGASGLRRSRRSV